MATYKRVDGDYTIKSLLNNGKITLDAPTVTVAGNLSIEGNVAITGSFVTNQIQSGTSNVNIAGAGAPVVFGVNGVGNVLVVNSNSANLTGIMNVSGNVIGGNILTSGIVSSTGNAIHGNVLTGGLVSATANITGGNILTAGIISATGNIVTAGNAVITGAYLDTGDALVSSTAAKIGRAHV